jgi:hypothetical protein
MRLRVETQELQDEEKLVLIKFNGKFGHFLFKENVFQESDIPTEDIEDKTKTPAKRLRAVLYRLFEQTGGKKTEFEPFYREKMEKLIDQIKARLD